MASASDRAIDVFPVPGGPQSSKIGPLSLGLVRTGIDGVGAMVGVDGAAGGPPDDSCNTSSVDGAGGAVDSSEPVCSSLTPALLASSARVACSAASSASH